MKIIKTSFFISSAKKIKFSDSNEKKLLEELNANPKKGDVIKNSGGLRKIRVALANKGKRSGARVIYYYTLKDKDLNDIIYLFYIYAKNQKTDLSHQELEILRQALEDIK